MTSTMKKPSVREFTTPMMQQYSEIKKQHHDSLLFFRMGDFYELFLDDAKVGARVLGITLTRRPRGKDGDIPMAGVPYHAADSYIAKLVKAGFKVAVCEQVSEPDKRGIVDREVVRIVTPGTVMDEKALEQRENNFTISLYYDDRSIGIAIADISTGDFQVSEFPLGGNFKEIVLREIANILPSECILNEEMYNNAELLKILSSFSINVFKYEEWDLHARDGDKLLKKHFSVKDLGAFGLEGKTTAITASAALLGYLKHTQKEKVGHIRSVRIYNPNDYVLLDRSTIVNLELFSTIRNKEDRGSFVNLIDQTQTAMGGRLLREWLKRPLKKKKDIIKRLDSVEEFYDNPLLRKKIRKTLNNIYDIERIVSRLSVGMGLAADLINLKDSLKNILFLKSALKDFNTSKTKEINKSISSKLIDIISLIETHISEVEKNGILINPGVNKKLDQLRKITLKSKDWIINLEQKEKQKTGISSLKVRFNKVFGYYIEVSKSNADLVPESYIRKQTLVNAERFVTPELKEQEEIILSAEETIQLLEQKIFNEVIEKLLRQTDMLQKAAGAMAELDCLTTFAQVAFRERYVKPEISTKGKLEITEGRHPVVEKLLLEDDIQFVPNDVYLDQNKNQLLIITGPNMAGKSVFIRQVALITLMAHIGSFVPAKKATISLVDRIFVRSGASDVISSGLSTFMVEMVETAHILNHATNKSLIVVDEIGRGTSTYDGISIAWAVAEYIVRNKNIAAKTLFATHYHELTHLEKQYPDKIKNYQMAVEEENGEPIFLHKVISGATPHSYAVAVAKLAGVPEEVTKMALEILDSLEERVDKPKAQWENGKANIYKQIHEELINLEVNKITGIEALNKLYELKEKINEDKNTA